MTGPDTMNVNVPVQATTTPYTVSGPGLTGSRPIRGTHAQVGPVSVYAAGNGAVRAQLARGVSDFLHRWEPPRVVTYGTRIAVIYPDTDGTAVAVHDKDTGRLLVSSSTGETDTAVVARGAYADLVRAGTDWLDPDSLRAGWAALTHQAHRDEFRRTAAWHYAAELARADGEADPHNWATRNAADCLPTVDTILSDSLPKDT